MVNQALATTPAYAVESLIGAVIAQAVEDYTDEYRKFIEEPTVKGGYYISIMRQYFEDDCEGLTSIGEYIVNKAERLTEEEYSEEQVYKARQTLVMSSLYGENLTK